MQVVSLTTPRNNSSSTSPLLSFTKTRDIENRKRRILSNNNNKDNI